MCVIRALVLVVLVAAVSGARAQDGSQVGYDCHGNALEACYIHINGRITNSVADQVRGLIEDGAETYKVLLNSKGGDLNAGLALGRAIRSARMETRIGVYQDRNSPLPGRCLSACAYAFLGGTQRILREDDRIGFHQFVMSGSPNLQGVGGLIIGQKVSSGLIAYMVEMGVDARLFVAAADTLSSDMYFPDREQRIEYDIETPVGFDRFFMEPYKNGVIAASKRLGPTYPYDRVDHLTAYCKGNRAKVLLTISGEDQFVPNPEYASFEVAVSRHASPTYDQWIATSPRRSDVRTWKSSTGAYIEMSFDATQVPIDDQALWFRASLSTSRADGGQYQASVELNDMDRRMLRAALRMCI